MGKTFLAGRGFMDYRALLFSLLLLASVQGAAAQSLSFTAIWGIIVGSMAAVGITVALIVCCACRCCPCFACCGACRRDGGGVVYQDAAPVKQMSVVQPATTQTHIQVQYQPSAPGVAPYDANASYYNQQQPPPQQAPPQQPYPGLQPPNYGDAPPVNPYYANDQPPVANYNAPYDPSAGYTPDVYEGGAPSAPTSESGHKAAF